MSTETLHETFERYRDVEVEEFKSKYRVFNGRGQSDFNAVAHALTSAGLVYRHGFEQGTLAGELREVRSLFDKHNSFKDSLRDNFNNKVGAAVAKYALENGLPEEALGLLVKDALDRGLLAVSEHKDPRVNLRENLFGRRYEDLFDGPSKSVQPALQSRFGIQSLDTGSLTGPGQPVQWPDLSRVTRQPSARPAFSRGAGQTLKPVAPSQRTAPGYTPGPAKSPNTFVPPLPRSKPVKGPKKSELDPVRDVQNAGNPFSLERPDLQKQATLVEENPIRAKQLIRAAGRDPKLFGFA